MTYCGIDSKENQLPIEQFVAIGAKGIEDQKNVISRNKTLVDTIASMQNKLNQTKQNLIKQKSKRLSFIDIRLYILLHRGFVELYSY